jgi:cholesterol 7alpha-monooxygenase
MMAYILFDDKLQASIKAETAAAVKKDEVDMQHLVQSCPRLNSVYHEVLRMTKRDFSFRKVERDTEVGGRLLRKGHIAMIPASELHSNQAVFGTDSAAFQPDRFLHNPSLATHASYRPFGGGKNYCPGRFFAAQEIFGFVAVLLHRLDIRLEPGRQSFPTPDESLLTLGVSRPLPGSDVWVTLANGGRKE